MKTVSESRRGSLAESGSGDAVGLGKNAVLFAYFPFAIPSRRLRVAAGQILSLGIALALLILSVPDACAQPFASRDLD